MTASHCTGCGAAVSSGRFCAECGSPRLAATEPGPPGDALRQQLAAATAGEYQILGELGRGGMAAVFLAEDLALGRRVAIKVMIPGLDRADGMADRFLLEARTAAQLSHPNIIPIYAVRTTAELRFFVMRYVAGRSLDRVLAECGPLDVTVVQAILSHVGQALEHAHGRGVVHRDVKPANIMLDEDGTPIVADFGIAKVGQGVSLTQTGSTMGTPTYMSPEQCSGKLVTGASDQYALGCVMFELLTGQPPFVHLEVVPVLLAHVAEPPPPLLPHRPDCPYPLAAAVDRMLAKDPAERWASLSDAIEAGAGLRSAHDPAIRRSLQALAGAGTERDSAPSRQVVPLPPQRSPVAVSFPSDQHEVLSLAIVPNGAALHAGSRLQLQATARDSSGMQVPAALEWRSSAPSIVAVSTSGIVTALSEGEAAISAHAADAVATVQVRVARVPVARVVVSDVPEQLLVGERVLLQAVARDQAGSVLPGRVIHWASLSPVAEVGPLGEVVARAPGRVRITATCERQVAESGFEVRVRPGELMIAPGGGTVSVGQVVPLVAYWRGPKGQGPRPEAAEWVSEDPNTLRVTPEGEMSALRPGIGSILVRSGGVEGKARFQVTRVDVASVRIHPQLPGLAAGETVMLTANPTDRLGTALPGRVVSWTSSDPEVAVVEPDGSLLGVSPGTTRVSASVGAGLAWLELRITAPQVGSVRLEPSVLMLRTGEDAVLKAIVLGGRGGSLTGVPITWESSDPTVASVAGDGRVTAQRFGLARIAATAGGRRATLAVEVRPPGGISGSQIRLG